MRSLVYHTYLYSKFKQHKYMQVNHSKLCQKIILIKKTFFIRDIYKKDFFFFFLRINKKDLIPLLSTKKCLTNMKVLHIPLVINESV